MKQPIQKLNALPAHHRPSMPVLPADCLTVPGVAVRLPISLVTGAIAVKFEWHGDRWGHGVCVRENADWRRVYQSVEGPWPAEGDPNWPASAALVEVVRMSSEDPAAAIVAVGLAGHSHFSASIIADPNQPQAVLFELACRTHQQAHWLGSTYELSPTPSTAQPQLMIEPVSGCILETIDQGRLWRFSAGRHGGGASAAQAGNGFRSPLTTVRWSYRIAPA